MSQPDRATVERWSRWFAVELNNRSWDLAEQATRSDDEDREMLAAAYGAAFHRSQVGVAANDARAQCLLAHVHSLLKRGNVALQHARRALSLCEHNGLGDWDLASAHIEISRAAAAAGDDALHKQHLAMANDAVAAIAEDEDRAIMANLLASVPTA